MLCSESVGGHGNAARHSAALPTTHHVLLPILATTTIATTACPCKCSKLQLMQGQMLADAYDAKHVEALTVISQEQEAMKQQLRSSIQQVSTEAHTGCWPCRAWTAVFASTRHGTRHACVTMPAGPLEDVGRWQKSLLGSTPSAEPL